MATRVRFHPEASVELVAAATYYDDPSVALAFLNKINESISMHGRDMVVGTGRAR